MEGEDNGEYDMRKINDFDKIKGGDVIYVVIKNLIFL